MWEQYDSHKYLDINIGKEYITNRKHLPMPFDDVNPKVQEIFMTLNLIRDDPEYMVDNYILPMKMRFIED